MRLLPYTGDAALQSLDAAPGWPHDDTADALWFAGSGGRTWLVLDDDDRVAGECGTKTQPDDRGVVEIGYGLAAASRGRGLGTRAVAALLDEIAAAPEVHVVLARVHPGNQASRRLLERLGFAIVRTDDLEVAYTRRVVRPGDRRVRFP